MIWIKTLSNRLKMEYKILYYTYIMFELIVAYDKKGLIGIDGDLPWNIRADLVRFRKLTMGHIVVMGRKTFETLPNGPLEGRINVVLTRDVDNFNLGDLHENVIFSNMNTIYPLLTELYEIGQKVFIIGGAEIYDLFFHECNVIHTTVVDCSTDFIDSGEKTYFPRLSEVVDKRVFRKCEESAVMFSEDLQYQYITYHRVDDKNECKLV